MVRRWKRLCLEGPPPALVTLGVGLLAAWLMVGQLQTRLRPTLVTLAQAGARNAITALVEESAVEALANRAADASEFVLIQRDDVGAISALSCDMTALNLLRAELSAAVLERLEEETPLMIQIPVGSLLELAPLWSRGPVIRAQVRTAGTVSAEFHSEFTSAGVNQTLHRLWLELSVPMTVLLPGGRAEAGVDTRLCVAETVIVGQVPDTYLAPGTP